MVVCKMLGLHYASNAAQTNFFGGNSSNILLSGIQCRGNETKLEHCLINTPYSNECPGNKDQIAGVVCTNSSVPFILLTCIYSTSNLDELILRNNVINIIYVFSFTRLNHRYGRIDEI